jgi:hypothetical protein
METVQHCQDGDEADKKFFLGNWMRIDFSPLFYGSRGSSVSIVSDYGLGDRGSNPDRDRGFFF